MEELIVRLHSSKCSCVIATSETVRVCYQRGIKDLYEIYTTEPKTLSGATVADKVVGRAAAAIMILGGVKSVYADIISALALDLFAKSSVKVSYGQVVPHIINRAKSGLCPLESATKDVDSLDKIFDIIDNFVRTLP
ncbi:MAG: DUF1893 domain-containing protein [Alistipes sp.]|nr:DUF1893 domain-containing protein [Alistipes sp.]